MQRAECEVDMCGKVTFGQGCCDGGQEEGALVEVAMSFDIVGLEEGLGRISDFRPAA
jgi:hypothetical protein